MSSFSEISPSTVDRENPWPGLESFTEDASAFFFGREKETDELSRLVRRQTLTVLFGQSGLGKSSLLQAGLFPILREGDHLPLYLRLDHKPGSPDLVDQVKSALNASFAAAKADAPAFSADETLWEYFHRKDVDIWSAKNRLLTPVLAFDQFEEIFTLGRADEACRERSRVFLAELACLVENRPPDAVRDKLDTGALDPGRFNFEKPSCQVILSLREDFLPDLEGLKQEMPALIHNRLRLKKLNGLQALEVVARPAPHLLADGVAEKIVEFVAGARGGSSERLAELDLEPPLLSVICRELNDRRRAIGQDQITADLVSGNRREILTDFYERSVSDLPEALRTFVEDHLLTKSGFRDNLALETSLEFAGVTRPLLDTLVSRRLLRMEDRLGVQRVELTHDVLADVIRGSRDARQQRLLVAADRRRARRLRWVIAGLATVVMGLLVGAFFGIKAQRQSARQASQTDVILASRLLDEDKLAEGLGYLVRAGRRDPTNPLVAPRLLSVLSSHRFLLPSAAPLTLPSPALVAGFSPDGRWVGYHGEDHVVRRIDTATWTIADAPWFDQKVKRGGFRDAANDGSALAFLLEDDTLAVVDLTTGRPRFDPIRPPEPVFDNRFDLSPDGRWLAVSSSTNVRVWDATTGELRVTLPGEAEFKFSPDGRLIATSRDRKATLWSILDQSFVGQPVECPPNPNNWGAFYFNFSADGRRWLIRHWDGVTICDTATGLPVAPMIPHDRARDKIILSPDGSRLIGVRGPEVTVVDVATGKPVYPALVERGTIRSSSLVDEGRTLFTNNVDGSVRFWDLATGRLLAEPTVRLPRFGPAAVSKDGKSVVIFTADGRVYPLRVGGPPAGLLELARDQATTHRVNTLPELPARISWLTPTSRKAIDVASGQVIAGTFTYPEPAVGIDVDPYSPTLGRGDVLVAQIATGELRVWTLGENGVANDVRLSDPPVIEGGPNSKFAIDSVQQRIAWPLAMPGAANDHLLGIWDTQSGRRVVTIDAGSTILASNRIAFSADGRRVMFQTRDDGVVHVTDLGTGQEVFTLDSSESSGIRTFRYSPDGQRILIGDNGGEIQVWDAANGELLRSNQAHRAVVLRFDFSPDRRFYASVSSDGSSQVWDAATDEPVGELREQTGTVSRADFSPDSTRIATPSNPGLGRVWDVQTGLPVTEQFRELRAASSVVAFTADGKYLIVHPGGSATERRYVRVTSVPPSGTAPVPDWLLALGTIGAEKQLTDEGNLILALDEFARIADVQRALAAAPADDPYAIWGRWILSDDTARSIAPGFTITPDEAAARALETPSAEGW